MPMLRVVFLITTLVFASPNIYGQFNLSDSLVACYDLNGNGSDAVSNLDGSLVYGLSPAKDRFNIPNAAYYFTGNWWSYITLPSSPLLKPKKLSLSCWIDFHDVVKSQLLFFVGNGCSSTHEGYQLMLVNDGIGPHLQLVTADSSCSIQTILDGTTVIIPGTWYHFGLYAGKDSLKMYLNGKRDAALVNGNSLAFGSSSNVFIGGAPSSISKITFFGVMDNLRYYRRELSPVEFANLFQNDPDCSGVATRVDDIPTIRPQNFAVNTNNEKLTIVSFSENTFRYVIADMTGKKLREGTAYRKTEIQLEFLTSGLYYCLVTDPSNQYVQKILIH